MPTEKNIRRFIIKAYNKFERFKKYNKYYIETDVRLSKNKLNTRNTLPLSFPLLFLAGFENSEWITEKEFYLHPNQEVSKPPFISFIVGEYGNGKTELIIQASRYIQSSPENKEKILPLLINLAFCRNQLEVLEKFNEKTAVDDFSRLIFSNIYGKQEIDLNFIKKELIPEIQKGNIFLFLDGLDELICNQGEARIIHQRFIDHFIKFLNFQQNCADLKHKFKVVISMRLEYLWRVCEPDARDLAQSLQNKLYTSVYFLQTEFLTFHNIKSYIKSRLNSQDKYVSFIKIEEIIKNIQDNNQLLDILQRPLYLRIFCDLWISIYKKNLENSENIDSENIDSEIENLLQVKNPALLFDKFIEQASIEVPINNLNIKYPVYKWNADKLAKKVLDFYKKGQEEIIDLDTLKSFLDLQESNTNIIDDNQKHELKLSYIHKCPFLQKISDTKFIFSHRAFLEFFVAKGISLKLEEKDFAPFNEIVTNVDMRKFLKHFAETKTGKKYKEITRKGNGMDINGVDGWKIKDFEYKNKVWKDFEAHRVKLLSSMIAPERPPQKLTESINWILEKDHNCIHSAYLTYAYEAIAVNVRFNWWNKEYKPISDKFNKKLKSKLDSLLTLMPQANSNFKKKELILLERILDICRRLRYEWIGKYIPTIKESIDQFQNQDEGISEVLNRISTLIKQIEDSSLVLKY